MAVITTERTARKPYRCADCHGPIRPGERYAHSIITPLDPELNNTGWWRSRAHLACYGENPNRE